MRWCQGFAVCVLAFVACQGEPARRPTAAAASVSPPPALEAAPAAVALPSTTATVEPPPVAIAPAAAPSASTPATDAGVPAPTAHLFVGTWVNKHAGDEVDLDITLDGGDLLIRVTVSRKPVPCDPMTPAIAGACGGGLALPVTMRGTVTGQGRAATVPASSVANGIPVGIGINRNGSGMLTLLSRSQLRFQWTPPDESPAAASGAIYTRQPP